MKLTEPDAKLVRTKRPVLWQGLAVMVFSLGIVAIFWTVLPSQYSGDDGSDYKEFYQPVAENVGSGQGIVLNAQPATKFPPGYPLILAGVFKTFGWLGISQGIGVAAVNLFGMAIASVFLFFIGRVLFGQVAALVGTALWMTYPFALWLTKQPNSEIPFMVFLYGGLVQLLYLVFRRTHSWAGYLLCGSVFGLAMLIRPVAIGIGLVLAISIWFMLRKLKPQLRVLAVALFLVGNVLTVLPWEAWVYSRTGALIPLSTSGATNMKEGLTFAVNETPYRVAGGIPADVEIAMSDIWQRRDEMSSIAGIVGVLGTEFRNRPIAMTKLYLLKLARSWYGTDSRQHESLILVVQLFYLGLAAWAATIVIRRATWGAPMMLIGSLIAYFWVMNVLVNSTLRYMLPAAGLLMPLIGLAFTLRRLPEASSWQSAKGRTLTGPVAL